MDNIKPVKKDDLSKLIEIMKDIFDYSLSLEEFENYFNEDKVKVWKISVQKIIGFVIFYHVKDEIEIIQIGITKLCQRKNYGSLILNKIKKLNDIKRVKNISLILFILALNVINNYKTYRSKNKSS